MTGVLSLDTTIAPEWLAKYHRWLDRGPKRRGKQQNKFGRFPDLERVRLAEEAAARREMLGSEEVK
jgi:hypothetical protein